MPSSDLTPYSDARVPPGALSSVPLHYAHPGLSLRQLSCMLRANLSKTITIAGAVTLLAIAAVAVMPRTYEATATLMVSFEVNDPLGGKDFPIGLLGSYMSTQIEMMRSEAVLLPVVDRLGLTHESAYTKGYHGDPTKLRQRIAEAIAKRLVIEQGRYGSQLIYVTYSAHDPVDAARFANAVVEIYMEQQRQRIIGPANDRAQRYQAHLAELKQHVRDEQDKVTEFHERTGILDSDSKIDVEMERLSTLQQRLLEAQNALHVSESKGLENQAVASQVLSSSLVQTLKGQLAEQTAHLAQMASTLGPAHPQLIEQRAQIAATRRALDAEIGSYSRGAASETASTRQLVASLQKSVDEQHDKLVTLRALQDEGARYHLDLDSAQNTYKQALDGYDQIVFASTSQYSNTSFVNRAEPPLKAAKPKALLDVVAGAFAGLALGLLAPLCWELTHRRIRCRDDLERDHDVLVLVDFPRQQLRPTVA